MQRRGEDPDVDLPRLESGGHRRLDDLPAPGEIAAQHPRLEALVPGRGSWGLPRSADVRERAAIAAALEIGGIDHHVPPTFRAGSIPIRTRR